MNKAKTILCLFVALSLSACAWVKLTPAGKVVSVLSKEEVASCKKVGRTTVSLKAKIIGIDRKRTKVAKELQTLGRNAGAGMGGDTIVVDSEIKNGEQTFAVYKCLRQS